MADQAHTLDPSGDHPMNFPAMSQGKFENAINRACEAAINKALNGLHEHISNVIAAQVAAQLQEVMRTPLEK
ncbi:hypothetical protein FANTH_6764 [Fusarium anthophilum]|uniref:Uncharacterized protein n=1 Tax=Fusarium anthophilum TaxID=48485 RepID=A0A8H5E471_9HYPO|nr:hypothetical protein FANTH_6764 [Fusarium anthophilum]